MECPAAGRDTRIRMCGVAQHEAAQIRTVKAQSHPGCRMSRTVVGDRVAAHVNRRNCLRDVLRQCGRLAAIERGIARVGCRNLVVTCGQHRRQADGRLTTGECDRSPIGNPIDQELYGSRCRCRRIDGIRDMGGNTGWLTVNRGSSRTRQDRLRRNPLHIHLHRLCIPPDHVLETTAVNGGDRMQSSRQG